MRFSSYAGWMNYGPAYVGGKLMSRGKVPACACSAFRVPASACSAFREPASACSAFRVPASACYAGVLRWNVLVQVYVDL